MEVEPIRVVDKTRFHESESQGKISVPKWFLNQIGDSETVEEVFDAIVSMACSKEEDLRKRKSIKLAQVRIKVINYENNL